MIKKIAARLVKWMKKKEVINLGEEKVYQYGLEILISTGINVIATLIIGAIFRKVVQTIFFLLVFTQVRKNIGGYHATTYFRCISFFLIGYTVLLVYVYVFNVDKVGMTELFFWALSSLIIYRITPVVDINNEMEDDMIPLYRKKGLINYYITSIILLGLYFIYGDFHQFILFGIIALNAVAFVGLIGAIVNKRRKKYDKYCNL